MTRLRRTALLFLILWPIGGWTKTSGTSTSNFLKLGVGGKGVAMGEAQTAAVDDVMSLYWNPAGLSRLSQYEVGFMHNSFIQGITQDVLYYGRPTETHGTFGVGLSMLQSGDIPGYDASGYRTGSVRASDTLLSLGWGKSMDDWVRFRSIQIGANVKFLRKVLDQDAALGAMVDVGALYPIKDGLFHGLRSGIVLQNLGPGLNFDGQRSPFPLQMKLGVAYPLMGENMLVATDLILPRDGKPFANFGMDYRIWEILSFRAGYKGSNDLDTGLSYGVRLGNERMHLDYAFAPFGPFGDSHRVSLGVRFGRAFRQERVQDQIDLAYKRAEAKYGQGLLVDAYIQATQVMNIAPWHQQSKLLAKRIESEFTQFADESRRQQLLAQVNDHYVHGEQLFQMDDLLHAKNEFEAILALQADHMGAKTYLNRIDERFKSIVDSFYEAAMRSFAAGDYHQAQEYLQRVLIVNPEHNDAREQLARVEMLIDKQAKVMEAQQRLERIRPIRQSAMELFEQKRYEEALAKFDEILVIDTTDQEALRYRGIARGLAAKTSYQDGLSAMEVGDFAKAQELLKQALRYDPDNLDIRRVYAQVEDRQTQNKRTESQKIYRDALDAFLSGDMENSLRWARKSLELDSDNLEAKRLIERLTQRRENTP